ncbi:MAG: methyltransferase domain-containing protein, partial [Verrucomicrobiota bacterium]|nr:methyltransferase domain-containing protein [Verrucomicrobiota bacterium]
VQVMDGARLSYADESFDLIAASDVLEHISSADAALREWFRVLASGSKLIVFVPAFQCLWSSHDVANHHQRRYSAGELRRSLREAGFRVERLSYWNGLLTLPGIAFNGLKRLFPTSTRSRATGGLVQPFKPINELLFQTISLENWALRYIDLPFGTSVFVVDSKVVPLGSALHPRGA